MSAEIEMKVPVSVEEIESVLHMAENFFKQDKFLKKMDSMFTNSDDDSTMKRVSTGGTVVRIREEGKLPKSAALNIFRQNRVFPSVGKTITFTTKVKTMRNGYETNIENELEIPDGEEMSKCLYNMGYRVWFNKTKYAYGFFTSINDRHYHVEIERVMNTVNSKSVLYVEIENTENDNFVDTETIIKDEEFILKELNLDPFKKDNRPWVEILR